MVVLMGQLLAFLSGSPARAFAAIAAGVFVTLLVLVWYFSAAADRGDGLAAELVAEKTKSKIKEEVRDAVDEVESLSDDAIDEWLRKRAAGE